MRDFNTLREYIILNLFPKIHKHLISARKFTFAAFNRSVEIYLSLRACTLSYEPR